MLTPKSGQSKNGLNKGEITLNRQEKKKVKLALGIVVVIILLFASINSIGSFLNPLKFVSEVTAAPNEYLNRSVQVVGVIVDGTWEQTGPNTFEFQLSDGNATVNVVYTGDVPGTFKPGVGITVIGILATPDKVVAHKLLAKCPSKYEETLMDAKKDGRI
ncbi:MAG TPA: cytochrome c maturation protein CcmE [Euryarchaeota archaeon]|nr:cytochrome c maturation protein CcmE [Euryarchaeota archaeon]